MAHTSPNRLATPLLELGTPRAALGAKLGYRLHRSPKSEDGKEFILVHKASSAVVLGAGYTAPIESVLEFLERERKLEAQKKPRSKH